eukprot:CAMPEP_0205808628 /NCGR_PEP_ID=MMETSP0205-20121125/12627_1 /ASSEMBLY_ACC=CAM_ASM_000278 /TAXON_ID=36767 /ORGANISM="Euplotes focardii, Strain TN1" /LENGTH=208 /DNA_ID=CAMNT_0053084587 /DNA_START=123 /DNA_END=746 /DNA_ORIENTATION=+
MILMHDCIFDILDLCKNSLMDLFLNKTKEHEINSYSTFIEFLHNILGEELRLPDQDCCEVFINTFSADNNTVTKPDFNKDPESEEYYPDKVKPVVEIEDEGDEEDADPDLKEKTPVKKSEHLSSLANLVSKVSEYLNELSKGNEIARAHEFSRQSEIMFLKHFGFKYAMNHEVLERTNQFAEIIEFVQREANNENVVKTKRPRSPKRK